jgi:UDP-N-acetylmuramoyl-tripeptide--D-alanyl-D-alanine ligase
MVGDDMPGFIRWIAVRLAKATAWRFKPGVVSIAGTAGKTTTKAATVAVISSVRRVRVAPDAVPTYEGLLLALLADAALLAESASHYRDAAPQGARTWFWVRVILAAAWRLVRGQGGGSPDVVVAEYGSAREVRSMLQLVRPTVAVLTSISDVAPAGSRGDEDALRDYARTVEQLPAAAFAVVPADDVVAKLRQRTRAHVLTYGTGPGAHVAIGAVLQERDAEGVPAVSADLSYGGATIPVYLRGALGPYHANAAAAAACVGIIFGATLQDVARAMDAYQPPASAVRLVPGIKDTLLIDDTYDAHLLSAIAGLELLSAYPAKRRIVVLGDLVDLGSRTMEVHERLGTIVKNHADVLVAVGTRAGITAESALKAKMAKKNVITFARADEAAPEVQGMLKKGDVVLLTGARVMRLDAVIDEVRMPETADVSRAREG